MLFKRSHHSWILFCVKNSFFFKVDKKFNELDDFSIFAILEALNKIDSKTMKDLIFEISIKNIIM